MIFAPGGEILEVNRHMADMLGYPVDKLVGKSVFEFMLPEERDQAEDREQQASQGHSPPMTQRTIIRKDGSRFVGEANLSPIMDEDGNVLFLFGVLRDLRKRKQLEEELSAIPISLSYN